MQIQGNQQKTVAFLGTSGHVSINKLGFDAAYRRIGFNLGNLLFQYGFWNKISNPKFDYFFSDENPLAKESFDILVMPAANQLNPNWDLGWWADFLESLNKPIVVAGLGAQAPLHTKSHLNFKPGTVRLMKVLSERARHIGVRGEFTQELLASLGITNTIVTGCPSNFITSSLQGSAIKAKILRAASSELPSVAYLVGTLEKESLGVERILGDACETHKAKIIYQTNKPLLRCLSNNRLTLRGLRTIAWERRATGSNLSLMAYILRFKRQGRLFWDATDWLKFAGGLSLNIGMRIHGAVAAIQGNGLGICVAFDQRTLELVKTMSYPHIRASDVKNGMTLRDLMSIVQFDENDFDKKRSELWQNFQKLLIDGGISVSEPFDSPNESDLNPLSSGQRVAE